jgi:adhesin HecA-like repeat protein
MCVRQIMKRHRFQSVLIALTGLLAVPEAATASAILTVTAPAAVSTGQSFEVDVDVSGVTDLYAFQVDLGFDPNILSATTIQEGSFLAGGGATFFVPGTIDNGSGLISATANTLLTAISGVSGSGTLIAFGFTAAGSGISPIAISNPILLDSHFNNNDATLANASVPVSSVPEPSAFTLLGVALARSFMARRPRQSAP